ncbi:MAG TPA: tetratricopeptide repeat protein [Phenylobacterium sp.]|jgi:tetratricopeptide (TPR) repeat protein|nr:tetratricopeptide repeat protein [Phenylobacterium sp.]
MAGPRRSRASLEAALAAAPDAGARAQACYELALFHDNNSREAEAIPLYRQAIALGLPTARRAEALAWLASSLVKTGSPDEARQRAMEARELTSDAALRLFLEGLQRRIAHRAAAGRDG